MRFELTTDNPLLTAITGKITQRNVSALPIELTSPNCFNVVIKISGFACLFFCTMKTVGANLILNVEDVYHIANVSFVTSRFIPCDCGS